MKTGRRNFMKLLGSTGLAAPLKKLQPAIDRTRVAIAKRVIEILLPANGVYVPQITGCAMIDFFLSMDHPVQIMPCGCRCSPEGDLIEGCEEEARLRATLDEVDQPVYQAANGHHVLVWQEYHRFMNAVRFYIQHCRAMTFSVGGEPTGARHAKTGEEITL